MIPVKYRHMTMAGVWAGARHRALRWHAVEPDLNKFGARASACGLYGRFVGIPGQPEQNFNKMPPAQRCPDCVAKLGGTKKSSRFGRQKKYQEAPPFETRRQLQAARDRLASPKGTN